MGKWIGEPASLSLACNSVRRKRGIWAEAGGKHRRKAHASKRGEAKSRRKVKMLVFSLIGRAGRAGAQPEELNLLGKKGKRSEALKPGKGKTRFGAL